MIERGYRILGWIMVAMGVCVPFLLIGDYLRGETIPWWLPLAFVGMGLSTIMVGLIFALPNRGPRFKVAALSIWGVFYLVFGVVALHSPEEILVRHGKGPRTIFMAQVRGVWMLVIGSVLVGWAVVVANGLRQKLIDTPDMTSR